MATIPTFAETSPATMGAQVEQNPVIQLVSAQEVDQFQIDPEAQIVAIVGFASESLERLVEALQRRNRTIESSGCVPPFFVIVISRDSLPELTRYKVFERLADIGAGVVEIDEHVPEDEIGQQVRQHFASSGRWAAEHFPRQRDDCRHTSIFVRHPHVTFWSAVVASASLTIPLFFTTTRKRLSSYFNSL